MIKGTIIIDQFEVDGDKLTTTSYKDGIDDCHITINGHEKSDVIVGIKAILNKVMWEQLKRHNEKAGL